MSGQPKWLGEQITQIIHEQSLAQHGGGEGLRDAGALESALAYPQNLYAYEGTKFARLAAGYLFAICKAHAFVDGNKRTAWAAMRAFLIINGVELEYDELEAIRFVEQVAAGELTFEDVAAWIRTRIDTPH